MSQNEQTEFGEKDWKNAQNVYASLYNDILANKNLDKHLEDVEQAIKELNTIIAKEGGAPTPRLDEMKNDLYFLKFQILERQ
ncbi:hypothetical protein SAMN05444008_102424 [Cnuella takakiae]|uniref:Uncharacterized protein n=1 Tax=Cnuella takakiae TaxID=1302690 RepID=A0A1M4VYC2_9BACT|nr:hypothetical protein [Cnuella takakiae]OLY92463.1 hypothetical protein BUE76_11630 [Cnuella takakiae]SHE73957.1 hypothetical protein SAMN05444008_102424 [Cnuella takakiae]